jgi:thioredoxin reductase
MANDVPIEAINDMTLPAIYDSIIVGGGPAGLSAALVLGRCRRRVLVCDVGHPRNERSKAMHGFLSRDGMAPQDFAQVCRDQLVRYPNVELRTEEIVHARREGQQFVLNLGRGGIEQCRTLLLATGIVDELPQIPGFDRFYGRSIHPLSLLRWLGKSGSTDRRLGGDTAALELTIELLQWSKDLVLCTNGQPSPAPDRQKMRKLGVPILTEPIAILEGEGDQLSAIRFQTGEVIERSALFFSPLQRQRSHLAKELGCEFCEDGSVQCKESAETCVRGLFAAGNASRGLQLVILAAAEGTQAAFAINERLSEEDRNRDLKEA